MKLRSLEVILRENTKYYSCNYTYKNKSFQSNKYTVSKTNITINSKVLNEKSWTQFSKKKKWMIDPGRMPWYGKSEYVIVWLRESSPALPCIPYYLTLDVTLYLIRETILAAWMSSSPLFIAFLLSI